ncbi:hypothetical protein IW261DRAFT_1346245 [Armillaria novae-zelandiae]|uniref:Uncharacterized protein n=1 Tax=Armillaria novae-zelandiae TaxID=153914 RepID=A0AA39NKY4_9AGAR|nr:hypothetical protein IW261DRAFT_1346245 [Armillaria novae-zelandiae]
MLNKQYWGLPSMLTEQQWLYGCKGNVVTVEEELREAQCLDALDTIRGVSCTIHDSYTFCDRNMQGQAQMTHAATFLAGLKMKLEAEAMKYPVTRGALLSLQGPGPWEDHLKVLQASNIETMDSTVLDPGLT